MALLLAVFLWRQRRWDGGEGIEKGGDEKKQGWEGEGDMVGMLKEAEGRVDGRNMRSMDGQVDGGKELL